MILPNNIRLKENSWLAWLAAKKMRANHVALVFGRTIHLFNISKEEFKSSPKLIRHELKHVEQYQRYGLLKFLWLYGKYSMKYGYYQNPLEVEARAAEEVICVSITTN
jgi:uncharacterized metal-binding protein